MSSEIRDIHLAESGERKIEWVKRNCGILRTLEEEFAQSKPFDGKRIALSIHLEAKTAYLCLGLKAGGEQMFATGANPLSTQDDAAAALVRAGIEVHAWHGARLPPAPMVRGPLSSGNNPALAYVLTKSGNRMRRPAASAPGKYIRSGTGNCKAG